MGPHAAGAQFGREIASSLQSVFPPRRMGISPLQELAVSARSRNGPDCRPRRPSLLRCKASASARPFNVGDPPAPGRFGGLREVVGSRAVRRSPLISAWRKSWSGREDLNLRLPAPEAGALASALRPAGKRFGMEPVSPRISGRPQRGCAPNPKRGMFPARRRLEFGGAVMKNGVGGFLPRLPRWPEVVIGSRISPRWRSGRGERN